jgi:magnesium transporter
VARYLGSLMGMRGLMRNRGAPGAAPGTLLVDPQGKPTEVSLLCFGPDQFEEHQLGDIETLAGLLGHHPLTWVDIDGLGDEDRLARLGQVLGLHPLALEDAVGSNQRPKVELYGEHCFMVVHMASIAERVDMEQLSIFFRPGLVVTLQNGHPGDSLEPVRKRLRQGRGRIRMAGADFLAYSLVDAVVDAYFPVLEEFGERLEVLEREVVEGSVGRSAAQRIYAAKHDLLTLRRGIWPLRDAIGALLREDSPQLGQETRLYLRDCHDHAVQLMDIVDTYREVASNLMDIHLSSMSHRMNEVMKVLTVIATIFIPLTFIAGVYGMNFDTTRSPWNMPELEWRFGYPWALGLMLLTAVGLVLYFKRQGWLGK